MGSEVTPIWDVLCLGETRAMFHENTDGSYRRELGGDASDVAVAVVRMGGQAALAGRVGADDFGEQAFQLWRAEGVDARLVQRDAKARTAHGFAPKGGDPWTLRQDCAGGRVRPGDLPVSRVARARVLHVSGIALGLSQTARVAAEIAADQARGTGALVSFAANYDPGLWDEETAASAMLEMIRKANILFLRPSEARLLIGSEPPEAVLARLLELGPQVVVMAWDTGVWLATPQSKRFARAEVDTVMLPAGDVPWAVLVGTYLSGLTAGDDLMITARRAVAAAVLSGAQVGGPPVIPSLSDIAEGDGRRAA